MNSEFWGRERKSAILDRCSYRGIAAHWIPAAIMGAATIGSSLIGKPESQKTKLKPPWSKEQWPMIMALLQEYYPALRGEETPGSLIEQQRLRDEMERTQGLQTERLLRSLGRTGVSGPVVGSLISQIGEQNIPAYLKALQESKFKRYQTALEGLQQIGLAGSVPKTTLREPGPGAELSKMFGTILGQYLGGQAATKTPTPTTQIPPTGQSPIIGQNLGQLLGYLGGNRGQVGGETQPQTLGQLSELLKMYYGTQPGITQPQSQRPY